MSPSALVFEECKKLPITQSINTSDVKYAKSIKQPIDVLSNLFFTSSLRDSATFGVFCTYSDDNSSTEFKKWPKAPPDVSDLRLSLDY